MKKIALSFILLLNIQLDAQNSKREEGIVVGVKGGLNISNFIGSIEDQGIRTSIHIGLLTEIFVSDNFSIQPELLYSRQGSTYSGNIPGFYRTKLDYISLPIEGKFKISEKLSIETGPQIGILVSSKLKTNDSNNTINGIKTIDFGINAGLQYRVNKSLFLQGRYILGLTDTGLTSDSNHQTSNSVVQLSIGHLF